MCTRNEPAPTRKRYGSPRPRQPIDQPHPAWRKRRRAGGGFRESKLREISFGGIVHGFRQLVPWSPPHHQPSYSMHVEVAFAFANPDCRRILEVNSLKWTLRRCLRDSGASWRAKKRGEAGEQRARHSAILAGAHHAGTHQQPLDDASLSAGRTATICFC